MSGLLDAIEAMAPDELAGALVALDHVSRPLTAREIEHALRAHGVSKSRAVIVAASVKRLGIVAVVGGGGFTSPTDHPGHRPVPQNSFTPPRLNPCAQGADQ